MLKEKPADIIHAVSVVPMLAPIITEMAWARVSRPALTNDTVITVVAVDDCTEAVTSIPVSMPVKRLVVMAPNTWRSWGPAIFCKLSLIDFIPNMSRARAPNSLKIIQYDIIIYNLWWEILTNPKKWYIFGLENINLMVDYERIDKNPLQK